MAGKMEIRKINKIKLFVSGLLLSLALGVIDYDILFLSVYDYSSCENKENTELVVDKASDTGHITYDLSYLVRYNLVFHENNRYLVYKLFSQVYNSTIVQLFNAQNIKCIVYKSSILKNFLSNSVYSADDDYIVPLV